MNAYGRVPHSLILYALQHYHFPDWLVQYMVKYYDELVVRISTKEWKSNWFFYMIGLFQGQNKASLKAKLNDELVDIVINGWKVRQNIIF